MMLLLLFWLPLIFIASIAGTAKKRTHRIAYCFGLIGGGIAFALAAFFIPPTISYTDTLKQYWLYRFLFDAALPVFCLLVCAVPVLYAVSCRSCTVGGSFLLGLLTGNTYIHLFKISSNPKVLPTAFIVLTYTCAVFIFNAAAVFSMRFSFPRIAGYTLGSVGFIGICAIGFFATALWYFNGNPVVYGGIFFLLIGISAAARIMTVAVSSQN
ncbi:MAG: hypothetical protein ACTTH7_08820 [Treponema sp.]